MHCTGRGTGQRGIFVAGACALVVFGAGALGGCATNRSRDRMKVLEAENIDLRQQRDGMSTQLRGAHAEHDRAVARVQEAEAQLQGLRGRAVQGEQAMARLQEAEASLTRAQTDLKGTQDRYAALQRQMLAQQRSAPPAAPSASYQESPQLEAFRRDLSDQLSRHGVNLPVEVRTSKDGARRVAVVLQNAFPPGSDSLASNTEAVKAVVNLGRLVKSSYPRSAVSIEGHTDSDPIRKSKWASNEALSEARADAVKRLIAGSGVPEGQVRTSGQGARLPMAKGTTARAKAQNRRVEIYIAPNG
jgi:flagellar motor protein MotB